MRAIHSGYRSSACLALFVLLLTTVHLVSPWRESRYEGAALLVAVLVLAVHATRGAHRAALAARPSVPNRGTHPRPDDGEQQQTLMLEEAVRERTEGLRQGGSELQELRQEMLRRLALASEYRDDETHQHTERIAVAAAMLAEELGLRTAEIQLIREAAPLHDIGKLAVRDSVLRKNGPLDASELEHMKRHAEAGAALLAGSSARVLQLAEEIAWTHHEWWDGSGYPRGLSGWSIPLSARIVAVVDVFDALTHRRPYKRAWTIDEARAEIRRLSGRQFDPQIVRAFERLDHVALVDATHAQQLVA
jgi:response regulator RpfG family c-di-GMP phosphodiesterase